MEAKRLIDGVLAPDKWKDYPHHRGKSETIQQHLLESRRLFLINDMSNCYYHLGVAFHYIQDAYTSFVWNSRNYAKGQRWHNKYEQWIDDSYFSSDPEKLIRKYFSKNRRQLEYHLQVLSQSRSKIEGELNTLNLATLNPGLYKWSDSEWGKPAVDFNLAFQVCLAITRSILGPRINLKLQDDLKTTLKNYEVMLRETEFKLANEIVESVRKRDKAREAKGFFSFLSTGITSRVYNMLAKSKLRKYEARKHLTEVAKTYNRTAKNVSRPYADWYDITIPFIDTNIVDKELLSVQESFTYMNKIGGGKVTYQIDDNRFVLRSELT